MQIKTSIYQDNNRLFVSGDINFVTAMTLWNESLPFLYQKDKLIFDFSKASFSNSAVLALLLEWINFSKQTKKSLLFEALPSQLMSIAAVAGIDTLITSYASKLD